MVVGSAATTFSWIHVWPSLDVHHPVFCFDHCLVIVVYGHEKLGVFLNNATSLKNDVSRKNDHLTCHPALSDVDFQFPVPYVVVVSSINLKFSANYHFDNSISKKLCHSHNIILIR